MTPEAPLLSAKLQCSIFRDVTLAPLSQSCHIRVLQCMALFLLRSRYLASVLGDNTLFRYKRVFVHGTRYPPFDRKWLDGNLRCLRPLHCGDCGDWRLETVETVETGDF